MESYIDDFDIKRILSLTEDTYAFGVFSNGKFVVRNYI